MAPKSHIRIRFARFGRRHQPLYNIVVAKSRRARDALPLEVLGMYNAVPEPVSPVEKAAGALPIKECHLDFVRAKYWLGVGAHPSDAVAKLFKRAGLLPPQWPGPGTPNKEPAGRQILEPAKEAGERVPPPVR